MVLKKVRLDARGKLHSIRIHDPAIGDVTVGAAQVDTAFTGVALELTPAEGFEARAERPRVRIGQLVRQVRGLQGAPAGDDRLRRARLMRPAQPSLPVLIK